MGYHSQTRLGFLEMERKRMKTSKLSRHGTTDLDRKRTRAVGSLPVHAWHHFSKPDPDLITLQFGKTAGGDWKAMRRNIQWRFCGTGVVQKPWGTWTVLLLSLYYWLVILQSYFCQLATEFSLSFTIEPASWPMIFAISFPMFVDFVWMQWQFTRSQSFWLWSRRHEVWAQFPVRISIADAPCMEYLPTFTPKKL